MCVYIYILLRHGSLDILSLLIAPTLGHVPGVV